MDNSEVGTLELQDEIGNCSENSSDSDIQILDDDKEQGEYESFVVDTSAQDPTDPLLGLDLCSSLNPTQLLSHFVENSNGNEERKSKGRRSGQACFNCDSTEHSARDCPLPRNNKRFLQNRNSFIKRNRASGRFHEDATNEIAPGKIGGVLCEALGIGEKDLPEWIYRMRKMGLVHGYPPAYRKRAATESISVFEFYEGTSSMSRKRKHKDAASGGKILSLDPNKVIKYPGFNYNDGSFRDQKRENFKIPPFDEFVNCQQNLFLQLDAIERRQNEDRSPILKKRKVEVMLEEDEEDDEYDSDVLIVKTRPSSGSTIEEGEIRDNEEPVKIETTNITVRREKKKTKKKIIDSKETLYDHPSSSSTMNPDTTKVENEKEFAVGQEPIQILETPIPIENHISAGKQNHEVIKPSLESFAKDIQPFDHRQPEQPPSGFIKKLHDIIRKVTRKN